MKYYIIENSRIPQALSLFINIWAITLYPFIICRGKLHQRTRTHEIIHLFQQRELLVIGFYLLYIGFWLWNLAKHQSFQAAYEEIPFEKEAYDNDEDPTYPISRKPYSWRKYL
tara:strand:+ start:345 stop:683 length:339 start_codon:yes stop_codon:yes gene_type:complete